MYNSTGGIIMDKNYELIYTILVRIEDKLDSKIEKVDAKLDCHIAQPHVKGYSVKQIGAVSGIITALSVAIGSIIKIFV